MGNTIFRTADREGDIWCEKAIVFPKDKTLTDVFTVENIRALLHVSSEDYPDIEINIISDSAVKVKISHPEELYADCTFFEMAGVLIIT